MQNRDQADRISVGIEIQPRSLRDEGTSFAGIFVWTERNAQKRCRRNRRRFDGAAESPGKRLPAVSRFRPSVICVVNLQPARHMTRGT